MTHGLMQIIAMNDEAEKIHQAKKLGIVPPDHPEHTTLTVIERDELDKARLLTYDPADLQSDESM